MCEKLTQIPLRAVSGVSTTPDPLSLFHHLTVPQHTSELPGTVHCDSFAASDPAVSAFHAVPIHEKDVPRPVGGVCVACGRYRRRKFLRAELPAARRALPMNPGDTAASASPIPFGLRPPCAMFGMDKIDIAELERPR